MSSAVHNLKQKAARLQGLMANPSCQELVSILEQEFLYGPLMASTPEQTAFNLGARDVVLYLRQLNSLGVNNGSE